MSKYFKMLAMAMAFVVIAALGASTAQASRGISLSATTIGASGVLTMNGVLTCDVLLSLTANSLTLSKTTGTNQARANGGYIRNCAGSLAGSPNTGAILGPINLQYRSFGGALPAITRINIIAPNAAFSVNTIAGNCLYAGALDNVGFDIASGRISGVDFDATNALARSSGSILCPSTGTIRGDLTTFLPSAPTVTLV
jgi:hypothetical protein